MRIGFVSIALFCLGLAGTATAAPKPGRAASPVSAPAAGPAAPIVLATTLHISSYDVKVHVAAEAVASIEHTLGLRVSGGALRSLEFKGAAQNAESILDAAGNAAAFQAEDGRVIGARVVAKDDGTLRLEPLEEKGLKRGSYTLRFALRTDLAKGDALEKDGVLYRLGWTSPPMSEGVDGMRVVFDLPAAPTEPRVAEGRGEVTDGQPAVGSMMHTLRRTATRDEVELVRPRVARGEAARWEIRVDPRALPGARRGSAPSAGAVGGHAPPAAANAASSESSRAELLPCAVALLVFALAWLRNRARAAAQATTQRLLLLPWSSPRAAKIVHTVQPFLVAGGSGVATGLSQSGHAASAALVVAASALLLVRAPAEAPTVRGGADWLPLRSREALPEPTRSLFEASSLRGVAALLVTLLMLTLLVVASARGEAPMMAIGDPLPVALVVATMIAALWVPDPVAWERLRILARKLRSRGLKIVPFGRVPKGGSRADELRLRVVLGSPMPGLLALELAERDGAVELLVRVREDSAAARKLAFAVHRGAASPAASPERASEPLPLVASIGRVEEQRVLIFAPETPSLGAACALAGHLTELLAERREGLETAQRQVASGEAASLPQERRGLLRFGWGAPADASPPPTAPAVA